MVDLRLVTSFIRAVVAGLVFIRLVICFFIFLFVGSVVIVFRLILAFSFIETLSSVQFFGLSLVIVLSENRGVGLIILKLAETLTE